MFSREQEATPPVYIALCRREELSNKQKQKDEQENTATSDDQDSSAAAAARAAPFLDDTRQR